MDDKASLITKCVDATLSQIDFIDKSTFYRSLEENYGIRRQEIGEKFRIFHSAIKEQFGIKHFEIEREVIRCLHLETKRNNSGPSRFAEIAAFSEITSIFSEEITENLEARKKLRDSNAQIRSLEERVKVYDDKLRAAEHLATIGQTAAMVGHDIRNPLQAIAGDLYLMENDIAGLPDGEAKRSLQESANSIEGNLYYINKIVSDLQDYARPLQPVSEQVEIHKVIEAALLIVPIPNNIDVVIEAEPSISPLKADFSMIKRVLSNLLHNAVQAMPSGGKLTIRAFAKKDYVSLEVEDTGNGIPDDAKPKLFTPMFTTKSKGQGFGLAVSKRLIEALGGTISFESKTGKGTKFIIELPC